MTKADDTSEVDIPALEHWLAKRLAGAEAVQVDAFEPPSSGYSAETTVFTAAVERSSGIVPEQFVLRQETPEPPIYPEQSDGAMPVEIEIQYRAMEAVAAHSDVPVASLLGYEGDTSILGAPFFVMGYVPGEVPVEDPIYTSAGFFVDASPDQRHTMITSGLETLAAVHRIDWTEAGLDWLVPDGVVPGTDRQIEVWENYANRELKGREHPRLADAFEWLHANEPTEGEIGIAWGDARPGNIIWQDFRPGAVTDFEAVSIGPAELDLGWWLMFDRWSHENMGHPRLEGEPTREEQIEVYAAASGREIGDLYFHEVFAAARYSAIVVRVMNRLVARGHLDDSHRIWIDNPAVTCMVQLLDQ